jgi:hypothetical protein
VSLLSSCQYYKLPSNKINFNDLSTWEERVFSKPTIYTHESDDTHLKAVSNNSASMLYRQINIDLNKTPYLNWQWKISNTYQDIKNERSKQGDDYPARVYVAIKSRTGSLYPRALVYVWSNHSEALSHWPNPYSDAVIMLALQSGDLHINQWITEKRNLKEDLKHYFNEEIDAIEGIAIMSDSDNSHSYSEAFYRNLHFSH